MLWYTYAHRYVYASAIVDGTVPFSFTCLPAAETGYRLRMASEAGNDLVVGYFRANHQALTPGSAQATIIHPPEANLQLRPELAVSFTGTVRLPLTYGAHHPDDVWVAASHAETDVHVSPGHLSPTELAGE